MLQSTPSLTEFDPTIIPYQYQVIEDIRKNFDYSNGKHEILLSGSVGSAKSILMAHIAVTHCLLYSGARVCLGRKALPDLKDTIFTKIIEHLDDERIKEGRDYTVNWTRASIKFSNGSEIISRSWADKKFKKFRSLELSALVIEELTENDSEYKQFYIEASARVGRLQHVPESFIIAATNPDSPSHWAYEYFINSDNPFRHVYYSVTTDNPFLPSWYIEQLKQQYDPKEAQRMIYGKWVSLISDVIYHQYDREGDTHFKKNIDWQVVPGVPIHICYDFNIGVGKPLSCCLFQYINGTFHFFDEIVIEGQRTQDSLEEMAARGLLDYPCTYIIHGDATGRHRDTRSRKSDYEIIENWLRNYHGKHGLIRMQIDVPRANPPVRERHNKVNSVMRNEAGEVRLQIYKRCKVLDKGFRLTHLKKGGQYIESEDYYQHITTAAGYGILSVLGKNNMDEPFIGEY